ncbi:MAG: hypothetical protein FNP40_16185 [Dehalobacter sp. 4CP]|nr:hypothetical protein [Dehalobacter sp. 4CP]
MNVSLKCSEEEGSVTVELTIVFTMFFICFCCTLFAYSILHNKNMLNFISIQNACEAASMVKRQEKINTEVILETEIFLEQNKSVFPETKNVSCHDYIIDNKIERMFIYPNETKVLIETENGFIDQTVKTCFSMDILIPFGKLGAAVFGQDKFVINSSSISVLSKPLEYIQNIDLTLEILNKKIRSKEF